MLVIGRKKGQSVIIGDDIEVTVVKVEDGAVKLAINAPKNNHTEKRTFRRSSR